MFHFRNPGLLPIEAITTLGISVKESKEAIGRFGTGLKYTIAGALRFGEEISIEVGTIAYYFHSVPTEVRGKVFNIVHMTTLTPTSEVDKELGFTTDLGKHWVPWMYIRELWSNCKDEKGSHGEGIGEVLGPNETRIIVKGEWLEEAYRAIGDFILNTTPLHSFSSHAAIHPGENSSIFYQKIKVGECPQRLAFTYNLLGAVELTEDRTIASWSNVGYKLSEALASCKDETILRRWFTLPDGFYENQIPVYAGDLSLEAKALLLDIWTKSPTRLSRKFQHLAADLFRPTRSEITFTPTKVERSKFEKALAFLKKIGFTEEIDWQFVSPEDDSTFGFVTDGKVFICRKAFNNGTQFLAQTMIEEYLHHVLGHDDYSRGFQDYLLAKVVSLGEEVQGEAL